MPSRAGATAPALPATAIGVPPAPTRRARRSPTPTRSSDTIAAQVAALGAATSRRRSAASRSGARGRPGHAAPRRRTPRTPPAAARCHRPARARSPAAPRRPTRCPRPRARPRRCPGARRRAGTACRDRSRGGRATTLTDVPAATGTPHESPAGHGEGCRGTSYPRPRSGARPSGRPGGTPARWPAAGRPRPRGSGPCASPARSRTPGPPLGGRLGGGRGRGLRVRVVGAAEGAVGGPAAARDEASPVHPVTRSAAAAMPTYPRMARP